ncbi:hypothetical protein DPMN_127043 [Dreissena polymorpha]|uniref:Uncharacterized protein n=1 Tax=Dreissena polymorpha TaxID=45954 RepID=A0A9D4JUH7_DREPO|nr:hypothetical protein DPMN_127043 [Dreissena polymorpha]
MELPKENGREGGLETPVAVTWIQILSRWAKHGGSLRDSPRTETPGGSWLAADFPDGTTGEDEMKKNQLRYVRNHATWYMGW